MTTVVRKIQDRRFWLEFIKEYKALPCLWNVDHINYANRKIRDGALFILLKKVREVWPEANLDVVKQRLNNFRRTFINEYNKVQQSKKDGINYVPNLYYYSHLRFLKENYDESPEISEMEEEVGDRVKYNLVDEKDDLHTIENFSDHVDCTSNFKSEIFHCVKEEEPRPKKRQRYLQEFTKNPTETVDSAEEVDFHIEDPSRIGTLELQLADKNRADDEFSEIEVLSEISTNALLTSQCDAEDEFDVIAKRVATHFRNMEPQQCLYAEKLIFDVCISGRLNRLTEETTLSNNRSNNDNPNYT